MTKTSLGKRPTIPGVTDLFNYEYYCCICFERLYEENIVIKNNQKQNVCKDCESKVKWNE